MTKPGTNCDAEAPFTSATRAGRVQRGTMEGLDMDRLPKLLVLSTSLPGSRHGGGVVMDAVLRRYPKGRYACFATRPPEGWQPSQELPESLRGVPCVVAPLMPQVHLRGARFYMPLLRFLSLRAVAPVRAIQGIRFGRQHGVEMVWAELQGDALVLAMPVARGLGIPLVGTVWDDPAGWLADGNYDRLSRRLLEGRFRESLSAADALSTAGEAMQSAYEKEYGVSSVVLRHGFHKPAPAAELTPRNGSITIGFVGSAYGRDAWEALFAAIASLNESHTLPPIRVRVFGNAFPYSHDGVPVEVCGWQPAQVMLQELAGTDFCYLPYWFGPAKRRHTQLSFPNKFETYLAAGRPVLFHGPAYAGVAQAVREHAVGVCVHSLQQEAVAAAVEKLARGPALRASLSRAALRAFYAEFNARVMMEQFAQLIGVGPHLLANTTEDNRLPGQAGTHVRESVPLL